MKKTYPIIASLVSAMAMVVLTSVATAATKPESCPEVNEIIKAGFNRAYKDDQYNVYAAYQLGNYGTNVQWAFFIAVPLDQATDPDDALNKATSALATLSGNPSPRSYRSQWYCRYSNSYGYSSIAATPVDYPAKAFKQVISAPK